MLANIPTPQTDQTLESYVALLQIENGIKSWKCINTYLFNKNSINFRSAHTGLPEFLSKELGSVFSSFEQLVQRHCLHAIFKPFVDSSTWKKATENLKSNNAQGIAAALGYVDNNPFSSEDMFCPLCAEHEVEKQGYAFAHRCHQVKGNKSCIKHSATLLTHNQLNSQFTYYHGLLMPKYDLSLRCGSSSVYHTEHITDADLNYGRWIEACFSGQLIYSDSSQRVQTVKSRLLEMAVKKNKASALFLNHTLIKQYGAPFLKKINHPISITESQWCFLYLNEYSLNTQPIANLLILSTLFTDHNHFIKKLSSLNMPRKRVQSSIKGNLKICWRYSLIKDILSVKPLKIIAKKHDICDVSIKTLISLSPSLKMRRVKARFTDQKRKYHKTIENYLIDHPSATRTDLFYFQRTAYNWIKLNDKSWFDNLMPSDRKKYNSNFDVAIFIPEDKKMAVFLTELLLQLKSRGTAIQITKTILKGKIERHFGLNLYKHKHPITLLQIDKKAETRSEYTNRIILDIGYFTQISESEKCISLATDLLKSIPFRSKVVERIMKILFSKIRKSDGHNISVQTDNAIASLCLSSMKNSSVQKQSMNEKHI